VNKIDTGEWVSLPSIPEARSHAPVIISDNAMYVFGGGGPEFQSKDSVVRLDLKSEKWEELTPMPTKRSGTAAFFHDGKVYVIGGGFKKPDGNFQFLPTTEIYDIASDTWASGPDMIHPHDYPAATTLNGAFYILGGHHPDACLGGPKTDPGFDFCERLQPGADQWEEVAPLPTPRFAAAAVTLDGHILCCGGVAFRPEGFNNFDFFETYSAPQNQWVRDDKITLPWPAAGHGLIEFGGQIYFFGGYSTDNIHNRAAAYDIKTEQWARIPDMPLPRAAMGIASDTSRIFLVGGWADDGRTPIDSVVAFQP
jgi:N-acetylneuraminic acid mutarotase